MKISTYGYGLLLLIILNSCDAANHVFYSVKNNSKEHIKLHVPKFQTEPSKGAFSTTVDTIIKLTPDQSIWIGTSPMDIDFPWATKKIYRISPGICGLELIESDTVIKLDCSKSNWKYKRKQSILKIKPHMLRHK